MTSSCQVFEQLEDVRLDPAPPVVLTVGVFDGLHRAHQALVRHAAAEARARGGRVAVLTFQNHPRSVLQPESPPLILTPWERKRELILAEGVDILAGLRFTPELAATAAGDFVREVILGRFHACAVLSGPGFHFGHNREGGQELLRRMGRELGFDYIEHEAVRYRDERVSSTRIRAALAEGDVVLAEALLTRPHRVTGVVVPGDRIGRTIGFPTANLRPTPGILLPRDGVYACRVQVPGERGWYLGMMNMGWRPTVGGRDHRVEVHLLGFQGDLEGQTLAVDFTRRLRDEQRFSGIDELRRQLARDRERVLALAGETFT
jgi:riboflavin kinase/FMN adenylyltransferase